jgi:hypothetical protein
LKCRRSQDSALCARLSCFLPIHPCYTNNSVAVAVNVLLLLLCCCWFWDCYDLMGWLLVVGVVSRLDKKTDEPKASLQVLLLMRRTFWRHLRNAGRLIVQ